MGTYYRGTLLQKEEVKVHKATKKEKAESKESKAAEVSDAKA